MESIGAKFKELRESRELTIRQVCEETNISPKYLEALENEEFDKFPSETYITGFIRSYAEYFKIDPEELIRSYKGYKIGESVTPLEELTKPTTPGIEIDFGKLASKASFAVIGLVFVGLLVAGGILAKNVIGSRLNFSRDDSIEKIKTEHEKNKKNKNEFEQVRNLKLSNNKGFALAYKNEAVQFLVGSKECTFILQDVGEGSAKIQLLPQKKDVTLRLNHAELVTFPSTSREVYITLRGNTENRAKIMVTLGGASETASESDPKVEDEDSQTPAVSTQVRATDSSNLKIVFEAIFISKTYLDLYLDGQQKISGVIQAGTRETWEANEFIQIKVGNAGGMKAIINGQNFSFGGPGQVANKVVTWKKDPSDPNLYNIVVKDW